MNKVWIVTSYREYEDWSTIEAVCSTPEIAAKKKLKIERQIQNLKTLYYLEHNSDYDLDLSGDLEEQDIYEGNWDNAITYEAKYPELTINTIEIQEKELL